MAYPAIPAAPQLLGQLGQVQHDQRRRSRRIKNRKRSISRAVRERNERAAHSWWQPSRSLWRPKPARSSELAAVLEEELEASVQDAAEFWADQSVGYSHCAEKYLAQRLKNEDRVIEERHREILSEIEAGCRKELMPLLDPGAFGQIVNDLSEDPEIGHCACMLEAIEAQALAAVAA